MTDAVLWAGYPRSFTQGRARPVQFVTLHYTAGSEGPLSAETGAQYDKTRPDGTSTHYFTDSLGPALQEVPDGYRAHTARFHGNEIGIHIEICGTRQTRSQWLDGTSLATLKTTAWLVSVLIQRHGLAFRRLSVAQTRAAYYAPPGQRPTGINDHYACTYAFPEDGGTHEDVGAEFPWDVFLGLVGQNLTQEVDMPKFFLLAQAPTDSGSASITGGNPMAGWRPISTWAQVQALATEYNLSLDIATWPRHTTLEANNLYGTPPVPGNVIGVSAEEIRDIVDSELDEAFRGAADDD